MCHTGNMIFVREDLLPHLEQIMIVVKLTGGLGNQMFQYAAGRRLALHHGTELKLDRTSYDNQPANETPRHYELDCFNLKASAATAAELQPTGLAERIKRKLAGQKSPALIYEKDFNFDPRILEAADNSLLIGFWQSEKYFSDVADTIRSDFSFKTKPTGKNAELAEQSASVNAISLHVRRADYANDEATNKHHGLAPLDYYREAVKQLAARAERPHFFVISDDPDWCKANIKIDFPTTFINHNGDKGYEDLRLMSLCRHHIIANSSFSWWGAWLNPRAGKIIYAPQRWLANPNIDTGDVTPADWIRL